LIFPPNEDAIVARKEGNPNIGKALSRVAFKHPWSRACEFKPSADRRQGNSQIFHRDLSLQSSYG